MRRATATWPGSGCRAVTLRPPGWSPWPISLISSGDGHVDLTARGNVQLRGIGPGRAGELARRAAAAGLLPSPAHDRARNITASPLAGLAGRPDLRDLVGSLDAAVRADPALAGLPGRFLFGLDDGTGRAGLGRCDVGPALAPPAAAISSSRAARRGCAARPAVGSGTWSRPRGPSWPSGTTLPASTRIGALPDRGAGIAAALGGVLGARGRGHRGPPAARPPCPVGPRRRSWRRRRWPGSPPRSSGSSRP